ncbi:glutamyl-tRNA reductase [Wenzhouxiangella limi]|uniref:Glutamyl-tRNA reductase n=1 Tax=Wenzhouxiangella limi TaxID=2707351 RepID=A0A845VBA9_9GAMM|nr:glutamyl-tRNA reductase [Wenzhouxiangella limi]NDY94589.1 glutamyl-tRNA reductase [Wenzhouxiangella limi]
MSLSVVGISHHTAPIAIRERLAFPADSLPDALRSLAATPEISGCAIVSTCNRTEIFTSSERPSTRLITDWLHAWHKLDPGQYQEHLYHLEHSAGIFHLMKVVCGADSMVVGEPQIAGQVKQAWQLARDTDTLDSKLDRMFQHAFAGSKRVRSETGIGQNPVTLPFAAMRLARQIFGSLDRLRILLVGAGEMIEDCAVHFGDSGIRGMSIANRSIERAQTLAERFEAQPFTLDDLPRLLPEHDMVLACTGAKEPILTRPMIKKALASRRHRPMFALDLSVPRNIDPSASDLGDLFLYTIDDLHAIVESGHKQRVAALQKAMEIIESEVTTFERWLRLQNTSATLKELRQRAQQERDELLEQAIQDLAAGKEAEAVIRRMGHKLVNRLLHGPSIRLRQAAESDDETLLEAARFYFLDRD